MERVKIEDIEIGKKYGLIGWIYNGYSDYSKIFPHLGNKAYPFLSREDVSRRIIKVYDNKIKCECGRIFIADATYVTKINSETYNN